MPRVTTVKKAQKAQGSCGKCNVKIKKGDSYRWWKFRYGGRRVRCARPECTPKASDLTQSAFYGTLYSIQETVDSAVSAYEAGGEPEDLSSALREAAEELRGLGEECGSSLENMPEGLQQGDTGQMLENRRDECESKADELESVADEADNIEIHEDWEAFAGEESIERTEGESDDSYKTRVETAMDEANDDLRSGISVDVDLSID